MKQARKDEAKILEELKLPLVEEELVPIYRLREHGKVRITKKVVTEERQITVTIRREELEIERLPPQEGDSVELGSGDRPYEETSYTIPLYEDQVEINTRPVLREEVRITKRAFESQRTFADDVRKEEVEIEETHQPGPPGQMEERWTGRSEKA